MLIKRGIFAVLLKLIDKFSCIPNSTRAAVSNVWFFILDLERNETRNEVSTQKWTRGLHTPAYRDCLFEP